MRIHEVHTGIQKYKKTKRLGRGIGTGQGKTAGRGHKGQYAHGGIPQSFVTQGGQMELFRRIGKRGFNNKFALRIGEVNLRDIDAVFENGEEVTPETLRAKDLAKYPYDILKVLGTGELTKKLKISAHRFSATARQKIEQAGGQIVELAEAAPVIKVKKSKVAGKPGSKAPAKK